MGIGNEKLNENEWIIYLLGFLIMLLFIFI